jgi:hypothetical protein
MAVGPGGAWYAVATRAAQEGQISRVHCYSREGASLATFDLAAVRLVAASQQGLAVATPERTVYINVANRHIAWSLEGGFEQFLAVQQHGVLAGFRDPATGALISRVLIVRLESGEAVAAQDFADLHVISAILPPNEKGEVGVIAQPYAFRFPLPTGKK